MRLKTFIATYLLFLCILFASVGIVSVHLTSSQVGMLKENSVTQYQTIVRSLSRDIAVLYGRGAERDFTLAVAELVSGYARYYSRQNIYIAVNDLSVRGLPTEARFASYGGEYAILITGSLPEPFANLRLTYRLDVTQSITEMRGVQRILLASAVAFSVIAAVALHLLLAAIFRPLSVIAKASGEIASGQFGERIKVSGIASKNELAQVAAQFNSMADEIQRQMACLEEEALSKQQFVDNFAHEVRTPLTSIYGYAEYLQKVTLDEREIIEASGQIMSQAEHMKRVANSLLELATLRDYTPVKSPVSLHALFEDVGKTMENPLRERGARMTCRSSVDTVDGQEDLLRSLLLNLCTNALKACTPSEGAITLEAKAVPGGVLITVSDNGCGIPKDSLPKVTEPFYRVDKSRNREHGGAGLGLTLCSKIAQVHGAQMALQSAPGTGTTARLTFTTS